MRGGWQGQCAQCGLDHYPRTDPAVIVAVTDGERLLLGRQASWAARRYSTLAGFVEPGETLEQTVAREVMEESSVRVRSSREGPVSHITTWVPADLSRGRSRSRAG